MDSTRSAAPALTRAVGRSIVGLDLLRFGAALLVVGFHLGLMSWLDPRSEAAGLLHGAAAFPELLTATRFGWIGVQMFFVISGFVIAFSAQGSTAARFLESRVLRLMPGIWICATLSFALALAFAPESAAVLAERYAKTLLVVPAPRWIDGVYWTLSIEMVFYALVWALLSRKKFDRLEPVMLAIGLFSATVWGFAATGLWPDLGLLAGKRVAQLLLVTHGCEFALGVLAWRIATFGWTPRRFLGAFGCLAGTLCQILASCREVALAQGVAEPFVAAALLFLAFFSLFALAILCNGAVHRRMSARGLWVVRLIGLSTYPLYLTHTFVGVLCLCAARALGMPSLPALVVGVGAAIAVSFLIARFAEPWLRRILAEAMGRLSQAARRAASVSGIAAEA